MPADKLSVQVAPLALTEAARGGALESAPPFPATVAQTAQHHSQHSYPQAGVVTGRCFILKAYKNHNFVIVKRKDNLRIYGPEFSASLESLWFNSKDKPHSYTRPGEGQLHPSPRSALTWPHAGDLSLLLLSRRTRL